MDYTLAKQLKEKGFPDNVYSFYRCQHEDNPHSFLEMEDSCEHVPFPQLKELIRECGKDIKSLEQNFDGSLDWKWDAHTDGFSMIGDTPEEAVARLWLEINK